MAGVRRVFLTLTVRVLVNAEALNMAESVGNLVRRKRLPVVVPSSEGEGFEVRMYPVVSGQSLAHSYQAILADRAAARGLPVCPLCAQHVFVKHADDNVLKRLFSMGDAVAGELQRLVSSLRGVRGGKRLSVEDALRFAGDFEEKVVASCVVEDVGGFLYTGRVPVRRTSRIMFSYMIPSLQAPDAVGVESVVHTRSDPAAVEEGGQAIYNVEVGSALYTFSVLMDLSGIGVVERPDRGVRILDDRLERVRAALEALAEMVSSMSFGAKRSRFLPHWVVESVAGAVVEGFRFQLPPGHSRGYIVEGARRLEKASRLLGGSYRMVYHVEELGGRVYADKPGSSGSIVEAGSVEEVFEKLLEWGLEAAQRAVGSSGSR